MAKQYIPYGHQWVGEDDIKALVSALKGDWLTQGPLIDEFEKAVAKYCHAKYAVAVSSGTAALHAAFEAAGIGKGDEVITTPLTFAATANAVVYCGGAPVFVDIDPRTLNIDPKGIEKKITKKTKAIAPVDFRGYPAKLNEILKIAKKHKLLVIEDASHAIGSEYRGKKIGSISDMTIFSFHPVKTITTGEGGMVVTNNRKFYEKMRVFRHHGVVKKPGKGAWYYEIEKPGYNYRITDLQCALGLSQMKKFGKFIQRRRMIVREYDRAFKNTRELILLAEESFMKPVYHLYIIQLRLELLRAGRRQIFDELRKQGIGVQVHYMPLHLHPFYKKKFGYKKGDFPAAEAYYERALTLPLFPQMTEKDVKTVVDKVSKVIAKYRK
ncbi:MAG: UDP-4-amino-4,6-dideoxy-N-acetyl-beta-L-altrosamine transaminase [Candidatus Wildermuthbacteria bacterium]|nr:UDP-4-amino-4,6-dideoxy-N-acetyl-beta-L-altrosamine transaminase [Candidatus Wildermuthbacteria bacterium]